MMSTVSLLLLFALIQGQQNQSTDWRSGDGIIFSSTNPSDGYYPNIGNGFIAAIVGCYKNISHDDMTDENSQIGSVPCGNIFMQAVYNGNLSNFNAKNHVYLTTSIRARIPGIHSIYIDADTDNQYNLTWLGSNVDIPSGTVNNRSMISHPTKCVNGAEIQITHYMHRYFRSLMVVNISLISDNSDCQIMLNNCNLKNTKDFNWNESQISGDITLRQMTTKIKENPNSTLASVGMAYQNIPNNITLSNTNPFISFYGVLHNSLPLDAV